MKTIYFFGDYIFETRPNRLVRGSDRISLPNKQLQLLLVLIRAEGRAVRKEELLRDVWPDVTVEKHTLAQTVHLLRSTLGRMPDGKEYIATVPRYGYRLAAQIEETEQISDATFEAQIPSSTSSFLQFWRRLASFFVKPEHKTWKAYGSKRMS